MDSLIGLCSLEEGIERFPTLLSLETHVACSGEVERGPNGGDERGLRSPVL
jgi:hypothetical protein